MDYTSGYFALSDSLKIQIYCLQHTGHYFLKSLKGLDVCKEDDGGKQKYKREEMLHDSTEVEVES
jgi:hypothetical protein